MKNENIDIIVNKTKNFLILNINGFDFNENSTSHYYIKNKSLLFNIDGKLFQINTNERNLLIDDNTKFFLSIEHNKVLAINKLDK